MQTQSNGAYKIVGCRARGGERGERAHGCGTPVHQRGDQPGGGARPRRGRARVPSYTYDDEYYKFWSRNLDQEHCLELFRCAQQLQYQFGTTLLEASLRFALLVN